MIMEFLVNGRPEREPWGVFEEVLVRVFALPPGIERDKKLDELWEALFRDEAVSRALYLMLKENWIPSAFREWGQLAYRRRKAEAGGRQSEQT